MRVDVVVIGSGQAGVPLAVRLAAAGRRVVIAERKALGGTCVNYGCTPTKTMVASAHAAHVARTAVRLDVKAGAVKVGLAAVVDRKDRIVRRWRAGVRRRLGSAAPRLTLVRGHARLIGPRQLEIAGERYEAAEGIRLVMKGTAESVSRHGRTVTVRLAHGRPVSGSHLLVAAGRRPNTDDLGADAAGIRLDAKGYIEVDERYRTSAEGVYAVGDCTPGPQFTHASWDDHRILFDLLQGRGTRTRNDRLVPITAFTDPQVARIGLTEREARARGYAPETATMDFGEIARAVETNRTAGTMKILLDPGTEKVLGVSIVGAEAGELIHIFAPVMVAGISARAVVDAEYVHPTFAEGVQSLVMSLARYATE